jgi:hypothetical protein
MLGHFNHPKKCLIRPLGIHGLAARAGYLIAEALEDEAAIPATIVLGKDLLDAAQIDPTAAGGAHEEKIALEW